MLEDLNGARTPAELAIRRINDIEQRRRRKVRGRDFNDWHTQLDQWKKDGQHQERLRLLLEIVAAAETLPQYDSREPRYEWTLWAATEYEHLGMPNHAVQLLHRWLHHWPEHRDQYPSHRAKILSRLRRLTR